MAQSLAEYYATNYTKCSPDRSFLGSWKGAVYPLLIVQLVSLPFSSLTFYCILKKTPAAMSTVKSSLLFSYCCTTFITFGACSLVTPYFFFPKAFISNGLFGLLRIPGQIQACLTVISISGETVYGKFTKSLACLGTSLSFIRLYEQRSSLIQDNIFRLERTSSKIILYSIDVLACMLINVPFLIGSSGNQEVAKLDYLKTTPCPTEEFFLYPVYVIFADYSVAFIFFVYMTICSHFLNIQFFFFTSCCVYYLFFAKRSSVSTETRKLQRRFFLGLCLQTISSFSFIAISLTLLFVAYQSGFDSQPLTNAMLTVFAAHSISESIVVILVHKSYREFVTGLVFKERGVKTSRFTAVEPTSVQLGNRPALWQTRVQ